ncbi:sulfatase-like hydrolase/transferase [Flammeovirga yaeyamensis]|uniref:Sulfatase-like hydrolase/transferase n=1 Tax=Flammeovirga yaeyamensis TaxID=367791 RepID=A0AAX1NG19_9BACT|nr:sulfatase [Flammeovirga yaeyamensis]MBB3696641.1 arylsulfatase A-like enzyme [Flammeovirga yaeyamensis]NMF33314.1 sulfatase [Flammeovirga yaeyamensis]QWG05408.1 sulfatase-like hydrolase/transferase [Flammeovirga yaeyamensis]
MKRILLLNLLVVMGIFSCQKHSNSSVVQSKKKPNIVYILTDQWRASATAYGGNTTVKTPTLDQLAKKSINFSNAVSVTPVCTPHRAALFTGRYPTTTGMVVNDVYLPEEELCMAEIFKSEGYSTAYYGKWHLDGHGRLNNVAPERRQGFDYWKGLECSHNYNKMPYYENDDPEIKYWPKYSPFAITEDANKYLAAHANDDRPFLLVLSIATPHYPHGSAPKRFMDMYPQDSLELPKNVYPQWEKRARKEMQGYYAHISATDEAIGNVLKQLENLGLEENTIVVFSSDHGEMLGAHGVKPFVKQLPWDESVRVPFLIKYPSIGDHAGSVIKAPINTPDILPSLLGLSDISIPETIEGEDLSNLMKSPDPNYDRAALVMNACPFGSNHKDEEYRGILTKQYTYVKTLQGPSQLFDNVSDPLQLNNLIDQKATAQVQERLEGLLQKEMSRIGDEFKPREYYLEKYNYKLDPRKHAINWWDFSKGRGVIQGPRIM